MNRTDKAAAAFALVGAAVSVAIATRPGPRAWIRAAFAYAQAPAENDPRGTTPWAVEHYLTARITDRLHPQTGAPK